MLIEQHHVVLVHSQHYSHKCYNCSRYNSCHLQNIHNIILNIWTFYNYMVALVVLVFVMLLRWSPFQIQPSRGQHAFLLLVIHVIHF